MVNVCSFLFALPFEIYIFLEEKDEMKINILMYTKSELSDFAYFREYYLKF